MNLFESYSFYFTVYSLDSNFMRVYMLSVQEEGSYLDYRRNPLAYLIVIYKRR